MLHWLPISARVQYKILLIVYKCLHGLAPEYLVSLLSMYKPVRVLRSSQDTTRLITPVSNRTFGDRAFSFCAPRLWNALPPTIRESPSVDCFKSCLKTYLFKQSYCAYL